MRGGPDQTGMRGRGAGLRCSLGKASVPGRGKSPYLLGLWRLLNDLIHGQCLEHASMWEVLDECLLLLLLIIHVYCRKLSMINQEKNNGQSHRIALLEGIHFDVFPSSWADLFITCSTYNTYGPPMKL